MKALKHVDAMNEEVWEWLNLRQGHIYTNIMYLFFRLTNKFLRLLIFSSQQPYELGAVIPTLYLKCTLCQGDLV